METYLAATQVIDWNNEKVLRQARLLGVDGHNQLDVARRCFEWVRDEIAHTMDCGAQQMTCAASEVLEAGHGFCFAKSHLLAALLRANGIPAGFDYQRLREGNRYMLHGLNTVHIEGFGWYRIDARGNKPGVDAHFNPPLEQLAWPIQHLGELDYHLNACEPLPEVISLLKRVTTVEQFLEQLPGHIRMG